MVFRGSVRDADARGEQTNVPGSQVTRVQYVVDVSDSTRSPVQDCNGDGVVDVLDDFNGDGRFGDVLDCEISAVVALNASLRAVPGSVDHLRVGLTAFGTTAAAAQMTRTDRSALFVAPGQTGELDEEDTEATDVVPNLNVVASSLRQGLLGEYRSHAVGGNTNFTAALTTALDTLEGHPGPRWIFFLSDGQASVPPATLARVAASGVGVRTFAVGTGAGSSPCAATSPLGQIAAASGEACVQVHDPAALTTSVVGSQPAWLTSVTVSVGGRSVEADIDPIGGWTATVPGLGTGGHTGVVTATLADGSTLTQAVPFRVATHLSYTALGDSYASGEGVTPYLIGQADELCHRSRAGWPALVTAGASPEPLSTRDDAAFRFLACSGARIVNLDTTPQAKKVGNWWFQSDHEVPLQLDHLNPDADLVTVSIGGNDLGFAPIILHCFTSLSCPEATFITTTGTTTPVSLQDWTTVRLALIGNELTGAYQAIRTRVSADTTIVATTYPRLVSSSPVAYLNAACWPPLLSSGERQWLRDQIDTFADIVHERARRPGARLQVVDVRDDFEGHNVCDRDAYLLGPTLVRIDDLEVYPPISAASFHPTARGARVYAAAVDDALRDMPVPGTTRSTAAAGPTADHQPATTTARSHATAAGTAPFSDDPVVADPESVLEQYPPDVVAAVAATTFAEAFLANGAALDGAPACDHVVAGEAVPVMARGFAAGSTVTAVATTVGTDGTEHGQTSTTHTVGDDSILRSTVVAPDIHSDGLLSVSLTGTNDADGPVIGTALASTSTDPGCRATVETAGRLAPPDPETEAEGPVTTDPVADTTRSQASTGTGTIAAPDTRLPATGAHIAWACAAILVLAALGTAAITWSRHHTRPTD